MNEQQQIEKRKEEEAASTAFKGFLENPMTKLGISMVPAPAPENRETLQLLLRSAFDAGRGHSRSSLAISLIENMFKVKDKGHS